MARTAGTYKDFESITDFLGNEIRLGDKVVYSGTKGMSVGTVSRIHTISRPGYGGRVYENKYLAVKDVQTRYKQDKYSRATATLNGWNEVLLWEKTSG